MLTSFFKKSAPINYLIVGAILACGFLIAQFSNAEGLVSLGDILRYLLFAGVVILTLLLLGFMISKNDLTKKNTYGILIFACFVLMIPMVFEQRDLLLAMVFCLFAFRRVFSFTSEKNIEKKILDASLWLALASFFYIWCLLYLIPLYYAILRQPKTKFRYLFIPILGLICVITLTTAFFYLFENSTSWFKELIPSIGFDFSVYSSFHLLIPATIFISLILWIGFYRLFHVSSLMRKQRPNYVLLLVLLVVSLAVALGADVKTGAELYFVIPALAIATTDYLENREERYIKEIFLWVIVLLPLGIMLL